MYSQRSCPVCGSDVLRRVMRDATFLANLGGEVSPLTDVMSYGCVNGHVFMILPSFGAESATQLPRTLPFARAHVLVTKS
jgi:hypothetical protein